MKRTKIAVFAISFILLLQSITFTASAGASQEKNTAEIELSQSYETFMQYAADNNLPVIFEFSSFKEEFAISGYENVDDYLNALYALFVPATDIEDDLQTINADESSNIQKPVNYRAGLDYSDELLQAYEDLVVSMEENNLPMELCLEDFADNYAKSGFNSISEYYSVLSSEITKSSNSSL